MVTRAPAVTYRPASIVQPSPSEMPQPELAPSRQCEPILTTWTPTPESVPMIEAPPPTSDSGSITTPAEIRPSTIDGPSVPALKLTNPAAMTVVPTARWEPRRTLSALAIRTPAGTT